jgi:cell division septal protein FtsQ
MMPADGRDAERGEKPRRQYPAAYERAVPIALALIAVAIVVLLVIILVVVLGMYPSG